MWRKCLVPTVVSLGVSLTATGQDLVRLPGQGQVKEDANRAQLRSADRLIPGGGLFLSFDVNSDGLVSDQELSDGIAAAFQLADQNEDGFLTPLEQISWSESLPTRDPSLSNPARFDPNLDRRVNEEEFHTVIVGFAKDVTDAETGDLLISSLRRSTRDRPEEDEARPERRGSGNGPPGNRQARRGGPSGF